MSSDETNLQKIFEDFIKKELSWMGDDKSFKDYKKLSPPISIHDLFLYSLMRRKIEESSNWSLDAIDGIQKRIDFIEQMILDSST